MTKLVSREKGKHKVKIEKKKKETIGRVQKRGVSDFRLETCLIPRDMKISESYGMNGDEEKGKRGSENFTANSHNSTHL